MLLEGTTDVELLELAAKYERQATGIDLFGGGFAVAAAGVGQQGGTKAVTRELVSLRAVARTVLLPNGRPMYRFVGLFDNDKAGRQAVKRTHEFDTSIVEFRDMFRLWPVLPLPVDLDPTSLQKRVESENVAFKGLDWELEDLLPTSLVDAFVDEHPAAVVQSTTVSGKIHRDFDRDGKARLHRFCERECHVSGSHRSCGDIEGHKGISRVSVSGHAGLGMTLVEVGAAVLADDTGGGKPWAVEVLDDDLVSRICGYVEAPAGRQVCDTKRLPAPGRCETHMPFW